MFKYTNSGENTKDYREKCGYPCPILNAVDVELHGDVKAVEEVTPKHQSVLGGVYSMDPPCKTHKSCQTCRGGKGYMHLSHVNTPEGIMKVFPCFSSILWQS